MKERPILFSGPMVRAILEGRKTQTRRVIKAKPPYEGLVPGRCHWSGTTFGWWHEGGSCTCNPLTSPYGLSGDRLWVRETWQRAGQPEEREYLYRADPVFDGMEPQDLAWSWKPSIHMPRWASRLTLEVASVRVERLQDISEEHAVAEGVSPIIHRERDDLSISSKARFRQLWDSINGKKHPWESNPWVWVVEFQRLQGGN